MVSVQTIDRLSSPSWPDHEREKNIMTTKNASKIAATLGQELTDAQLRTELELGKYAEADIVSIVNAYRQMVWDTEDELIGAPTPAAKPAKKPAAKAAKKSTAKKPAAKPAKKAEPKVKKPGTDAKLRELILAGKTNEQALAATLKAFPKAKTSIACASWNRSQLRNHGEKYGLTKAQMAKVLTNAEAAEKNG